MMEDFTTAEIQTGETSIFVRSYGSGPPILLLHGFPQTHLMWRSVAPLLARNFTVVCADLRGYGLSGCPDSAPDHEPYSKRAMAQDMVTVMERLGFPRYSVAGHDRGGRVAYRMALDHLDRVDRLAVLDVLPTGTVWDLADARFTLALVAARPARAAPRAYPDGGPRGRRRRRAWRVGLSAGHVPTGGPRSLRRGSSGARPHPRHLRGVPGCRDHRPRARRDGSCERASDNLSSSGPVGCRWTTRYLVHRGGRADRALAGLGRRRSGTRLERRPLLPGRGSRANRRRPVPLLPHSRVGLSRNRKVRGSAAATRCVVADQVC